MFYINNISFYVAPVILYSALYVSNISCLPHQPSGWQPSYTHQTWHWKLPIYVHPPSPASSWLSFSCSAESWTTFLSSFSFYGSITEAHSNASYPTYLPLIISITIMHPTLFSTLPKFHSSVITYHYHHVSCLLTSSSGAISELIFKVNWGYRETMKHLTRRTLELIYGIKVFLQFAWSVQDLSPS